MLEEIMRYCRNWFPCGTHNGEFEIICGRADLPFLKVGQYYRIEGSVFNDGLHRRGIEELEDETFAGYVTALNPPKAFLQLCEEITEWQEKNAEKVQSPFQSESFGGYSYTKASGADGGGNGTSWQTAFGARLKPWRRL